jgi:hypothetical protein
MTRVATRYGKAPTTQVSGGMSQDLMRASSASALHDGPRRRIQKKSPTPRPTAGAHMASGANTPHAGECTVHPIEADRAAIAVVAPTEIPEKTSTGRQGIMPASMIRAIQ